MSKSPKKKPGKPKESVPVLYLRLTPEQEAALQGFIAAQPAPPDRTSVGVSALLMFLERHGFWPPKPKA